jgi:hypothetical protein
MDKLYQKFFSPGNNEGTFNSFNSPQKSYKNLANSMLKEGMQVSNNFYLLI